MFCLRVPSLIVLTALAVLATAPDRAAASGAYFSQACTAAGVETTLHWLPAPGTLQQYVGFGEGLEALAPFGPFDGSRDSVTVGTLKPSATYVAVLMQQVAGGGWSMGDALQLNTYSCVVSAQAVEPTSMSAALSSQLPASPASPVVTAPLPPALAAASQAGAPTAPEFYPAQNDIYSWIQKARAATWGVD
jgi:hypothetical protein